MIVNGHPTGDADAFLRDDHVWAWIKPIADALEWVIDGDPASGPVLLLDDEKEVSVPPNSRISTRSRTRSCGWTASRPHRRILTG